MPKGKTGKGKKRPTEDDEDERRAKVEDDEEAPPRKKKGKGHDEDPEDNPEDNGENGDGGEGDDADEEAPPRKGKKHDDDDGELGSQKATELPDDKLRKYKPLPPDEPIIPPSPDCFGVLHNPKSDKCQICEEHHNGMCLAVMLMRQRQQVLTTVKPKVKLESKKEEGMKDAQSKDKSRKGTVAKLPAAVQTLLHQTGFSKLGGELRANGNKVRLVLGGSVVGTVFLKQDGSFRFEVVVDSSRKLSKLGLVSDEWSRHGDRYANWTGESVKQLASQLSVFFRHQAAEAKE